MQGKSGCIDLIVCPVAWKTFMQLPTFEPWVYCIHKAFSGLLGVCLRVFDQQANCNKEE